MGVSVDALLALPRWVYVGVFLGALLSAGVAATFVVVSRLVPDGNTDEGTWRSTEERRRAEMRRYLSAIGERFSENATVHGRSVAFHLPDRDVAVTFDAKTFLALEDTPTDTILAEHEMPGVALGYRLPFETPDFSVGNRDGRENEIDPERAAYAVLGLPTGADAEDIQRAYRERIKEVHPDHGGDEETFKRVREAYDTATQHAD